MGHAGPQRARSLLAVVRLHSVRQTRSRGRATYAAFATMFNGMQPLWFPHTSPCGFLTHPLLVSRHILLLCVSAYYASHENVLCVYISMSSGGMRPTYMYTHNKRLLQVNRGPPPHRSRASDAARLRVGCQGGALCPPVPQGGGCGAVSRWPWHLCSASQSPGGAREPAAVRECKHDAPRWCRRQLAAVCRDDARHAQCGHGAGTHGCPPTTRPRSPQGVACWCWWCPLWCNKQTNNNNNCCWKDSSLCCTTRMLFHECHCVCAVIRHPRALLPSSSPWRCSLASGCAPERGQTVVSKHAPRHNQPAANRALGPLRCGSALVVYFPLVVSTYVCAVAMHQH